MKRGITRREREVTDPAQILDILNKAKIVHIGLVDGDEPYVVPMNYGFTMESPVPGCILDYAGPAPWYYLLLQIPAFGLFCLLRLPVREKKCPA